jgi:signal transduction histidine kinase
MSSLSSEPETTHFSAIRFPSSLSIRILVFTGSVLLFLLLMISQVLLFQWREVIIAKQSDAAMAVSKTFSVTVIDALIREGQSLTAKEGILQTYVDDFVNSMGNIKYVMVSDNDSRQLAIAPPLAANVVPSQLTTNTGHKNLGVRILEDRHFSWVIEVHLPLRIAQKSWGTATIGFDATPIREGIQSLFVLLFVATMAVSGMTLMVLLLLANRLTFSLNTLVHKMDSVAFEFGSASSARGTQDEVMFLFDRFEMMKKRIDQSRVQLEQAQRQIYQAEKLASIGRLASGVAHQVNNPLNGIRSCLYAIGKEPGNVAQTKEYIDLIGEAITNIEVVVKKLLGFARQKSVAESQIDISSSARKVADLFDVRLREKQISLILNLPDGLPLVMIDQQLFQEVVMNLLLNSYDAVDQQGTITITVGQDSDSTVFLTVKDDGIGIKQEQLEQIFEPFYTTKESGKGTGLGLSVCQSIIENHGGKISVRSDEGYGAEFTVILPIGKRNEGSDH